MRLDYIILGVLLVVLVLQILLLVKKQREQDGTEWRRSLEEKSRQNADDLRRSEQSISQRIDAVKDQFPKLKEEVLQQQNDSQQKLFSVLQEQTERVNRTLSESVARLQEGNEQKLEQMRQTVDEKLNATLATRLDTSFKTVGMQLKSVYESLGQMKQIAGEVGNLQRTLNNVKTRGTWAEVQLGQILQDILTPDQFAENISPKGDQHRVEYAIRIPSKEDDTRYLWLPIDSKFPQEAYARLCDASERGDKAGEQDAVKELEHFVKDQAAKISKLYLDESVTTNFAIMFLPTEGLYAEVLRRPGLTDYIQRTHRVVVCGPTTLSAFLNTLSLGFKTIALDRHASEVWKVLGATKEQYAKFGDLLSKAKKKVEEAGNALEAAENRSAQIQKKLRSVEQLNAGEDSDALLGLDSSSDFADYLISEE